MERRNAKLSDALYQRPHCDVGGWLWVYNPAATTRQGSKQGPKGEVDADAQVLKAKLSLNWTGPFKILAVGPCDSAPDRRPVGKKLLYLNLPSDMPGADAKRRVAVERCKPCTNPHDTTDMPRFLPAGLTPYVLNNHSIKSPPYHVTGDDVVPAQRMDVKKITGHQCVRGRGGVIAVLYKTHWQGLLRPSWEREMDLSDWRRQVLLYWLGTPDQHRQTNRLYHQMRIVLRRAS